MILLIAINSKISVTRRGSNSGICFRCLNGYHQAHNCNINRMCNVMIKGRGMCNRYHHPIIHFEQSENVNHKIASGNSLSTLLKYKYGVQWISIYHRALGFRL